MKASSLIKLQRGATLVVGLIMLVPITLLVTSAFTLSASNLKSVGNMQTRDEAIAAGNKAIEQVLSSPFTNSPAAETIEVDIDNDSTTDYLVEFAEPTCIGATKVAGSSAPPSSITLGSAFSVVTGNYYETLWDLDAQVADEASKDRGTSVHVRQGVRVLLTQAQYNAVCS
jgi:hypothetical protein